MVRRRRVRPTDRRLRARQPELFRLRQPEVGRVERTVAGRPEGIPAAIGPLPSEERADDLRFCRLSRQQVA